MAKIGKRKFIRQRVRATGGTADPKYLASCYGKIRRAKEEAYEEAKQRPSIVKAYRCTYCAFYHIGRKET